MEYILVLVQSSAVFLPTTFTMTQFADLPSCEAALAVAKTHWQTVNDQSKCIDIAKEKKISDAKEALKKALNGK